MASPFYGGPERQMLGLARHLPRDVESVFLSFAERGLAQPFMDQVHGAGIEGKLLQHNAPHLLACIGEVANELRRLNASLLCASGYKPDLIGWRAARRVGIPVMSVSHGWTAATWKVRCYEALDRWVLRRLDAVVCVSHAQAQKVRAARVPDAKITVIQNSIGTDAFVQPSAEGRVDLARRFTRPPRWIVGAAGRFSPEKGFANFVEAAAILRGSGHDVGFVAFGDGPLRSDLERLIEARGLKGWFVLPGFFKDLRPFLPNLDVGVIPSYTEGLPVILLENGAAGTPTVATAVGGIPEVIDDGQSGLLAPAGDPAALADRIAALLADDPRRRAMGDAARERIRREFSFAKMAQQYQAVFERLVHAPHSLPGDSPGASMEGTRC